MDRRLCETIDRFIAQYTKEDPVSGQLRVTVKDEILFERRFGWADADHKTPFPEKPVFTLYSLSKPFCALGLLKLKDRGKVDIDRHPGDYVPEARGFDPAVTIRQMLHHTSGLPDFSQTAKFGEKYPGEGTPEKLREWLKELVKYPMVFAPGTQDMYANINFILGALIIENVTGTPYADYMKAEVFEPLGMRTAQVDGEGLIVPDRVSGHDLRGGRPVCVDRETNWMLGAGDIIGTADDVYCLNRAIKHRLLLRSETWDEVLTPSPLNDMGMGCRVTVWHGKRRITHNGGSAGFRTLHIQLPEDDFDIIFLSNSGWGNFRPTFAEAVYEAYYGDGTAAGSEFAMDAGYI